MMHDVYAAYGTLEALTLRLEGLLGARFAERESDFVGVYAVRREPPGSLAVLKIQPNIEPTDAFEHEPQLPTHPEASYVIHHTHDGEHTVRNRLALLACVDFVGRDET